MNSWVHGRRQSVLQAPRGHDDAPAAPPRGLQGAGHRRRALRSWNLAFIPLFEIRALPYKLPATDTGGWTKCMLDHGAGLVVAVDPGKLELEDERVSHTGLTA